MPKPYFWSPLLLQKLIWVPTRIILFLFGHFRVRGLENLVSIGSNAIFACNHTSELDPILLPAALPFWSRFSPIFYTSRQESFYTNSGWRRHFYGGTFFKIWGAYPVFGGLQDYEKSLTHHLAIVGDGGSLCIYPEGRITPDGNVQPAKGGVAFLAHATKVPIVPVRLDGAYRIGLAGFLSGKRRLTVTFGKPFLVDQVLGPNPSIEELKVVANQVMGLNTELMVKS